MCETLQNKIVFKTFLATTFLLCIASLSIAQLAAANPYMYHEFVSPPRGSTPLNIEVYSPQNNSIYQVNDLRLDFKITSHNTSIGYLLGAYYTRSWLPDNVTVYKQNTYSPEFPAEWDYNHTLKDLPDGNYTIVITTWGGGGYADRSLTYYFFDMTTNATINFKIDTTKPQLTLNSPQNKTYTTSEVTLNCTISEAAQAQYSLDGKTNETLQPNSTLTDLAEGGHNLTIYAWDEAGNFGQSTVHFNIAVPIPTPAVPIIPIAAVALTSGVIAVIGLYIYNAKQKSKSKTQTS